MFTFILAVLVLVGVLKLTYEIEQLRKENEQLKRLLQEADVSE